MQVLLLRVFRDKRKRDVLRLVRGKWSGTTGVRQYRSSRAFRDRFSSIETNWLCCNVFVESSSFSCSNKTRYHKKMILSSPRWSFLADFAYFSPKLRTAFHDKSTRSRKEDHSDHALDSLSNRCENPLRTYKALTTVIVFAGRHDQSDEGIPAGSSLARSVPQTLLRMVTHRER